MDALRSLASLDRSTLIPFCKRRHEIDLQDLEADAILSRWKKDGMYEDEGGWLVAYDRMGTPPTDRAASWLKNRLAEIGKFPNLGVEDDRGRQPTDIRFLVTLHCWTFTPVEGAGPINLTDLTPVDLGVARSKISHTTLVIQPVDKTAWRVTNWSN